MSKFKKIHRTGPSFVNIKYMQSPNLCGRRSLSTHNVGQNKQIPMFHNNLVFYPYNNREDGVCDSNLYFQLKKV